MSFQVWRCRWGRAAWYNMWYRFRHSISHSAGVIICSLMNVLLYVSGCNCLFLDGYNRCFGSTFQSWSFHPFKGCFLVYVTLLHHLMKLTVKWFSSSFIVFLHCHLESDLRSCKSRFNSSAYFSAFFMIELLSFASHSLTILMYLSLLFLIWCARLSIAHFVLLACTKKSSSVFRFLHLEPGDVRFIAKHWVYR